MLGMRTRNFEPWPPRGRPFSTSTASPNWGSSLGGEKDVTSISGMPASTMPRSISSLRSTGTWVAIDCSPSRAQHSQKWISSGR